MAKEEFTVEQMQVLERDAVESLLGDWQGEPLMVAFFIPLPEPLELAHRSAFTFVREEIVDWMIGQPRRITGDMDPGSLPGVTDEGQNIVSLLIWRPRATLAATVEPLRMALRIMEQMGSEAEIDRESLSEDVLTGFANEETYDTVVEATTPLIRLPGQNLEDVLSSALDRCLEELAALMRAYLLMTRNHRVLPVTRQNVYPWIPYAIQHPFTGHWFGISVLRANDLVTLSPPSMALPIEKHQELATFAGRLVAGDPVSASIEWARLAWRGYDIDGDFRVAVIASHTAAETMLDTMLLMAAYEEGSTSPEAVAKWFEDGLVKRISKHYAARFGGPWQPADPNTVIGTWVVGANRLRHRVLHGGYTPTQSEARAALDAFKALEAYAKERLAARRSTYPRTTLMIVGVPGLERLGLYGRKFSKFAERFEPTALSWLADYRQWAQQVDGFREP